MSENPTVTKARNVVKQLRDRLQVAIAEQDVVEGHAAELALHSLIEILSPDLTPDQVFASIREDAMGALALLEETQ
jgi:hypothetical protein